MWKCVNIDQVPFCEKCHSILNLPNHENMLTCSYCEYKTGATSRQRTSIRSTLMHDESNPEPNSESKSESKLESNDKSDKKNDNELRNTQTIFEMQKELRQQLVSQMSGKTRKMISEECPKCQAPEMAYTERQLRSVDEGQSIFYECLKCGYKNILHS